MKSEITKIKIKKTTYAVTSIGAMNERGLSYTVYNLIKKNTVKVLTQRKDNDEFALSSRRYGRVNITYPTRNEVTFFMVTKKRGLPGFEIIEKR